MRRTTFIGLLLLVALVTVALFAGYKPVSAGYVPPGGIVVNDLGDNTTGGDTKCTLREAINNANSNSDTTSGDCAAGSGADTITFSISGTINLQSSLPTISTDMTIDGLGQTITISGDSDNNGTGDVRIFNSTAITWNLKNLTVAKGHVPASVDLGSGAAISTVNTNLNIYRVTFTGNTADHNSTCCGGGGAIRWFGATVTIDQSTFTSNDGRNGGAIFGGQGTLNITNSTFTLNTAEAGGAIIISNSTTATASNSTFYGNTSGIQGGAIVVGQGGSTFNFINVTIAHNTAGDEGGGIYNLNTVTVANSIIANNSPGASCGGNLDLCNKATFTDNGNNIISGNPGLDTNGLQNNGGPTLTVALQQNSAALDAANDVTCANAPVSGLDQRGITRPQGAHCDIGAYEADGFQTGPNYVVNTVADTDDGFCSVLGQGPGNKDCTLREAINAANAHSGADTITFNLSGTITVTSGLSLPNINDDVTIDGTGQSIIVSGNNAVRVMAVNAGKTLNLLKLTIANGYCNSCSGGGLFNGGTANVTNSTFSGNNANINNGNNDGGGGIYNTGTLNVTGSTFSGNGTIGAGGGINNRATLTLTNSTFSGNNANSGFGGGLFNYNSGTLNVINSTLSGNTANVTGGIMNYSGTLNFTNTIIANSGGGDCFNSDTIGTNKNNLVQDGSCALNGVNFHTGDPLLGSLGNNGGPTQTMALLIGSPAINNADDATCAAPVGAPTFGAGAKDQRAVTRPQGAHCDIGSFEAAYALTATAGTPQSTTVGTAFTTNLAATLTENGTPVSGISVIFTAPVSGASGTFANTATNTETVTTDANGVATASQFTANNTSGSYDVTATITGFAGSALFNLTNDPGGLTHFGVSSPGSVTAGSPFNFMVTAQDQFNNTITGYAGTVHFTKSDNGSGSAVPTDSALTNGTGTFSATLVTAGNQTITATDSVNSSINGTSNTIAVNAAGVTHFSVNAPSVATAGSTFSFTVTALDQFENVATSYTGPAHFISSDGAAVLPADSALISGVGTFDATLKTAGNQTITASDQANSSINGISNTIAVSASAATHLAVTTPAAVTAGSPFSFTVTAQDQFNNTATGYGGIVHFTKSDNGVGSAIPADSSLINGAGNFSATLVTAGNQTITATDTLNSSITGMSAILVNPAPATHFLVSAPPSAQAGVPFNFTVTAQDQFNNTVTGYGGTVHFTKSDNGAGSAVPADSSLVNGSGNFSATLVTAGDQTITATDTGNSSITGTATIGVSAVNLTISKTHLGNFSQADTGKTYTITVSNIGSSASSGTVTVTDNLPAGLTATGWAGAGWTCTAVPATGPATLSCNRSDSVAASSAFDSITLTVDVSCTAAPTVTNTATVAGGNDATPGNNTSNDITTINPDSTKPAIVCPGGISKYTDSGQITAKVNLVPPVATDNCGSPTVTGTRSDGKPLDAPFNVGVTIVTWTAKDAANNTTTCPQSITVMVPSSPRKHPDSDPGEEEAVLTVTDVLLTVLKAVW